MRASNQYIHLGHLGGFFLRRPVFKEERETTRKAISDAQEEDLCQLWAKYTSVCTSWVVFITSMYGIPQKLSSRPCKKFETTRSVSFGTLGEYSKDVREVINMLDSRGDH